MSSGGGGSNTVVQQSNPPKQFLDAYSNVLGQAQQVASQPLQQYNGNLVAGFSPDQMKAMSSIDNAQGIANPYINAASQHFDAATSPIWNGVQQFSPSAVSQYQSPYTQQVVNATQAQFNNQNQQQALQLTGNQVAQGAYGGDRSAIGQAALAGQQQTTQAPVIAGLNNQGYTQALGEFNNQQQAQIGANEANSWLNSQAGFGLGSLGSEAQNSALTGASAQLQAGGLQQQLGQENLNIPFEQFQQAQAYPFQSTSWLGGIAEGAGGRSGGTGSSTTSSNPSMLSTVAGLGTAGLGAYGLLSGTGLGTSIGSGLSAVGTGLAALFNRGGSVGNDNEPYEQPQRRTGTTGIAAYAGGGGVPDVSIAFVPNASTAAMRSTAPTPLAPQVQELSMPSLRGISGLFGRSSGGGSGGGGIAPAPDMTGWGSGDPNNMRRGGSVGRAGGGGISVSLMPSMHGGAAVPMLSGGNAVAGSAPAGLSDYLSGISASSAHTAPKVFQPNFVPATPKPDATATGSGVGAIPDASITFGKDKYEGLGPSDYGPGQNSVDGYGSGNPNTMSRGGSVQRRDSGGVIMPEDGWVTWPDMYNSGAGAGAPTDEREHGTSGSPLGNWISQHPYTGFSPNTHPVGYAQDRADWSSGLSGDETGGQPRVLPSQAAADAVAAMPGRQQYDIHPEALNGDDIDVGGFRVPNVDGRSPEIGIAGSGGRDAPPDDGLFAASPRRRASGAPSVSGGIAVSAQPTAGRGGPPNDGIGDGTASAQTAGTPEASSKSRGDRIRDNAPWLGLLGAGLGILAGHGNGVENIGRGGLEGLKTYSGQLDQADKIDSKDQDVKFRSQQLQSHIDETKARLTHQDQTLAETARYHDVEAGISGGRLGVAQGQLAESQRYHDELLNQGRWSHIGDDPNSGLPIMFDAKSGKTSLGDSAIAPTAAVQTRIDQGWGRLSQGDQRIAETQAQHGIMNTARNRRMDDATAKNYTQQVISGAKAVVGANPSVPFGKAVQFSQAEVDKLSTPRAQAPSPAPAGNRPTLSDIFGQ